MKANTFTFLKGAEQKIDGIQVLFLLMPAKK